MSVSIGACSDSDTGGEAIGIVATQTECRVAQTALTSGKHSFRVDNQGSDTTEVYIYAAGDKVVTEKEHIGPGTQAKFSVTLDPGEYEVACKPGERGTGIRQKITVS
ncbi:MAG TPA: cupredoxin domain-containing protein [Acidimicrobiales bacterium]|nr:cupredoxin domain-containing protein [Acidimicrobiales bacterium]